MISKVIGEIKARCRRDNLKANLKFMLSGFVFVLLILQLTKIWILIMAATAGVSVFGSLYFGDIRKRFRESSKGIRVASRVIAFLLAAACAVKFVFYFTPSSKAGFVADAVGINKTVMLILISSFIALFTLYYLALVMALVIGEVRKILLATLLYTKPADMKANLKENKRLFVSSCAFMLISARADIFGAIATVFAFGLLMFIFTQVTRISEKVKGIPKGVKVFSLISAVGVCVFSELNFVNNLGGFIALHIVSLVLTVVAFCAVFSFLALLMNHVSNRICPLFSSLNKFEIGFYVLIVLALCTFTFYAFSGSNAFWGTDLKYDIVYTSDSADLVNTNVYMRISHSENDLRQPLFGVLSAPFVAFGYLIGLPLSFVSKAYLPMCMNFVQIILFMLGNVLLAKMMKLTGFLRPLFVSFLSCTYFSLLFTVMMEQYLVSYFWLMFVLYGYFERKEMRTIDICIAGGTLLTSMVVMPYALEKRKDNIFIGTIRDVEKILLGFVVIIFALGRLDFVFDLSYKANVLASFTGGTGFVGRVKQYVSFVASCFVAPETMIDSGERYGHISYQLSDNTALDWSIVGFVIILLCALGFLLDRKNKFTQLCALWAGFSALLLLLIGWGAAENGMILYALYFGWAFAALIYRLFVRVSELIKFKLFTLMATAFTMGYMCGVNYNGIMELFDFAFTYYPY